MLKDCKEIEDVKILSKACLPILIEYIDEIGLNLFNMVNYQHTDKFKSYSELLERIRVFCFNNQHLYLEMRDFESDNFCVQFYDFTTIYEYFLEFQKNLNDILNSSPKFREYIYFKFNLNENAPNLLVSATIFKHKEFISDNIDKEQNEHLYQIASKIEGAWLSFLIKFLYYRGVHYNDIINNEYKKLKNIPVTFERLIIEDDKKSIYIDQNIASDYVVGKNKNLNENIKKIKDIGRYRFVFSPYLIEDGIKMDIIYFNLYIRNVLLLTDGILMGRIDDELSFVKENPDLLIDRILKWLPATSAAEEYKYIQAKLNEIMYPNFNKQSKLGRKISNDINSVFNDESFMKNTVLNPEINRTLYDFIEWKIIDLGFGASIDDLISSRIICDNDSDVINKIEGLCSLLDVVNYKTESLKDKSKIKSSYQDIQHLTHAFKCEYLVTNDNNLIMRGRYIYNVLGLKTKFINGDELHKFIDQ
ncbi:hypothetical protein [Pectobacterium odoriferum]|uniref:hypothetical protein n=1 Tax=Pectobacterium odoriferum TaxID=78398 RepID=UPI000CD12A6F|nr:hypothetical protein [Pectobacterium odoriferum]POD93004.1 hypothetical protein BV925_09490 [Pectobacterium odoriferum]